MNGSKCKHCNLFISGTNKRMKEHLVRCEAERPYVCDAMIGTVKCGRRFFNDKGLGIHKGVYHTAEEKGSLYRCTHCLHGTDNPRSLADHEVRCARGEFRRLSRSRSRGPSMSRATSVVRDQSMPRERSVSCGRVVPRDRNPSHWPSMSRSIPSTPTHRGSWASANAAADDDNEAYARLFGVTTFSSIAKGAHNGWMRRSASCHVRAVNSGRGAAGTAPTTPSSRRVSGAGNRLQQQQQQQKSAAADDDENDSFVGAAADDDGGDQSALCAGLIDEQGMYDLSLVDPAAARLVMYEQHKSYDDIMERMRDKLEQLKDLVKVSPDMANVVEIAYFEERLKDYFDNHSAEALEKSGNLNLGIAEREAAGAALMASASGSNYSTGSNY